MPYIDQERRASLRPYCPIAKKSGELNFQITVLLTYYLEAHDLSYQTINDIVGALEGAKAEFQRRIVGPYEDRKVEENGDVY